MKTEVLDKGDSNIAEFILRSLPEWFGIETALQDYIAGVESRPMVVATQNRDALGFLSITKHSPYAAEIYVMGVLPTSQRKGVGACLLKVAERYLVAEGVKFLQVKTLSPRRENEAYRKTRLFYEGSGFHPLEEFLNLWGKENPCLLLIKHLGIKP